MIYDKEIIIVSENSAFSVEIMRADSECEKEILFLDKIIRVSDNEFPRDYTNKISGQLSLDNIKNIEVKSYLIGIQSNSLAMRMIDVSSENFYFFFPSGSQFFLIKFSVFDIIGAHFNSFQYTKYLIQLKKQNLSYYSSANKEMQTLKTSIEEWFDYFFQQKLQIQKLKYEINEITQIIKGEKVDSTAENCTNLLGECVLCCDRERCIVFIPCGHVISCLECSVRKLKVELNRKTEISSAVCCPLCKGRIEEAYEIKS